MKAVLAKQSKLHSRSSMRSMSASALRKNHSHNLCAIDLYCLPVLLWTVEWSQGLDIWSIVQQTSVNGTRRTSPLPSRRRLHF